MCIDPVANGLQVPPNYLVPIWEYAGTYVEWTGWDPARWWEEGVTMRQASATDFTTLLPPLSNGLPGGSGIDSQLWPAVETAGVGWPGSEGGRYDISIRFGLPPTCMELVNEYGLAQRRGDPLNWDDWEVTPITNRWVFEYQLHGNPSNEYENLPAAIQLYPFDYGRNRWTDDVKFFDIGQETPYPVAHGRGRYLNVDQPGITRWEPQGRRPDSPTLATKSMDLATSPAAQANLSAAVVTSHTQMPSQPFSTPPTTHCSQVNRSAMSAVTATKKPAATLSGRSLSGAARTVLNHGTLCARRSR